MKEAITATDDWANLDKRLNAIDTLTGVYTKLEAQGLSHNKIVKKLTEIVDKHNVPIELLYEVIGYPDGYDDNISDIEMVTIEVLSEIVIEAGKIKAEDIQDVEFCLQNLISHYRAFGIKENKIEGRVLNVIKQSGKQLSIETINTLLNKEDKLKTRNTFIKQLNMKIYRKVLGIFSAIIAIALFVVLIVLLNEGDIDWLEFFILCIPLYALMHYLVISRFGFYVEEGMTKNNTVITVATIIIGVSLFLIPYSVYINERNWEREYEAKEQAREYEEQELKAKLKEPITWKDYMALYGIKCQLKTRLVENKMQYIFYAEFTEKEKNISAFYVTLYDKDGFQIKEFTIGDWTQVYSNSGGSKIGLKQNDEIEWYNSDEYQEIERFGVAIRSYD